MSRRCPGKEVSAASDDFRLKEKKVWLKGRQRIVAIEAEQVAFVMQIGRRQLISLRQADLADLLEAALGSVITSINTCCAAALASTALHNGAYTTVFDPKLSGRISWVFGLYASSCRARTIPNLPIEDALASGGRQHYQVETNATFRSKRSNL